MLLWHPIAYMEMEQNEWDLLIGRNETNPFPGADVLYGPWAMFGGEHEGWQASNEGANGERR